MILPFCTLAMMSSTGFFVVIFGGTCKSLTNWLPACLSTHLFKLLQQGQCAPPTLLEVTDGNFFFCFSDAHCS